MQQTRGAPLGSPFSPAVCPGDRSWAFGATTTPKLPKVIDCLVIEAVGGLLDDVAVDVQLAAVAAGIGWQPSNLRTCGRKEVPWKKSIGATAILIQPSLQMRIHHHGARICGCNFQMGQHSSGLAVLPVCTLPHGHDWDSFACRNEDPALRHGGLIEIVVDVNDTPPFL